MMMMVFADDGDMVMMMTYEEYVIAVRDVTDDTFSIYVRGINSLLSLVQCSGGSGVVTLYVYI